MKGLNEISIDSGWCPPFEDLRKEKNTVFYIIVLEDLAEKTRLKHVEQTGNKYAVY